jgi:DNA-binding transcriptional regulator GbsR (MarR family)
MRKTKEKIKIGDKKFKVEQEVSNTLKSLAQAVHSHEVALMTWLHKDYNGSKRMTKDKKDFRDSLKKYCMQIPGATDILSRMEKIDKELEQSQNKKEEVKEAKE